jgi:hypothetical protein
MTGGRSGIIDCDRWGHIEFIHTKRKFDLISTNLVFDVRLRLWRANTVLAMEDMIHTRRSLDLVEETRESA